MKEVNSERKKATVAIFLLFLLTLPLCTAKSVNCGAINQIEICVEAKGYKDFVPHYQFQRGEIPHFPLGSTVYIYVEAEGKTKIDPDTCEYVPEIVFSLTGTKPRGNIEFKENITSTELVNHDLTHFKETYAIFSIRPCCVGLYSFKIEAFDNNMGGRRVGVAPFLHFYVSKDAYLYPPERYVLSNLSIEPNPANENDTVAVNISVKNVGGRGRGEGKVVTLYFNGTEVESKKVVLGEDEEEEVTFKLEDVKAGEWLVGVDGINATLSVRHRPTLIPTSTPMTSATTTPPPHQEGTRKIATAVMFGLLIGSAILFAYAFLSKKS